MVEGISIGKRVFSAGNYIFLCLLALSCLLPIVHVMAVSLSSAEAAGAGAVKLWPVKFTLSSYEYVLQDDGFLRAFGITVQRVLVGTALNLALIVLTAYPLSKETSAFLFRTAIAWYYVFTILFGGGLIPFYMTVKMTGLIDSLWALIIPGAVPVFSVLLMLNFFRGLPKELVEAAFIDGAGHMTVLWRIFVPLSKPALATIALFSMVGHWNSWFDGLILMNNPEHYPLQSFLQNMVIKQDFLTANESDIQLLKLLSDRTLKSALIFLGTLPILLVYPFLQKYFMKGIVLGSVKE
ncbi:carbohydrate ABC transporter permease [Paenibacillus sp. GCM10027626]|uniref:carbohydrate ABC transporter permease n=1 Tax=Paenibacillus sp. GCM10027626 TaxID=3273411 RepID=UPI0036316A46